MQFEMNPLPAIYPHSYEMKNFSSMAIASITRAMCVPVNFTSPFGYISFLGERVWTCGVMIHLLRDVEQSCASELFCIKY